MNLNSTFTFMGQRRSRVRERRHVRNSPQQEDSFHGRDFSRVFMVASDLLLRFLIEWEE